MKNARIVPKRKANPVVVDPQVMDDEKIRNYQTIWRRSGESYVAIGDEPEKEESSIPNDDDLKRQRAIQNLVRSYSAPQVQNVVKARVQEKKGVENIVVAPSRSRIISVSDLRFEEKRVVSPLASMRLTIGDPKWSNIEDELEARNFYISSEAKRIIGLNKEKAIGLEEMDLFLFKVKDISPEKVLSSRNFFTQAEFYGYGQCPIEAGPYSRLSVQKQNPGDEFCIGMEPVDDSSKTPVMFSIKQTGQYEGTRRGLVVVKADSGYHGGFSPESKILLKKLS